MPTTRTRRSRIWAPDLDDYRKQELVEGLGVCRQAGHGYGLLGEGALATAQTDWAKHGEPILSWWTGETDERFSQKPWIWPIRGGPGSRPWAWWEFDAPEAREADEAEADYIDRLNLWRRGERARWVDGD